MLNLLDLSILPALLLIFARITAFFVSMPLFSYKTIPMVYKVSFSFFISIVMVSTIEVESMSIDHIYILLLAKEVVVGLMIGLIAYIILSTVQIAGGFID